MILTRFVAFVAFVTCTTCVTTLPGCALLGHPNPAPSTLAAAAAPESRIDRFALALVVHKSRNTLSVYRNGTIVDQYPAVFGQRAEGDKRFEGDLRTPEGLYRITRKRAHARWKYFLELDYPNDRDRARYEKSLAEGLVPVIRSKPQDIGGGIGIHGSDRPRAQRRSENWTRGCIALSNDDVDKIQRVVKVGTPVLVLP